MNKNRPVSELLSWEDIRYFLAVADAGSASRAAENLGVRHSTVGKRLADLEGDLQIRLFTRKPGASLALTEEGEAVLSFARGMESAAREILALRGGEKQVDGDVSILATEGLATYWLVPAMMEFRFKNPGLKIQWITTTELSGSAKAADIVLLWQRPTEEGLVGRRIGSVGAALFTTPAYVERKGLPSTIDDLSDHDLLHVTSYDGMQSFGTWTALMKRFPPAMEVDSPIAVEAAMKGPGFIGLLPHYSPLVVPWAVSVPLPIECRLDVWLAYPEHLRRRARIKAVVAEIVRLSKAARGTWLLD